MGFFIIRNKISKIIQMAQFTLKLETQAKIQRQFIQFCVRTLFVIWYGFHKATCPFITCTIVQRLCATNKDGGLHIPKSSPEYVCCCFYFRIIMRFIYCNIRFVTETFSFKSKFVKPFIDAVQCFLWRSRGGG